MRIGAASLVILLFLLTLTSPLFFGSPAEAQPEDFLEIVADRTRNSKLFVSQTDPDLFQFDTFLAPIHYETSLDSGVFDGELNLTPRRIINDQLDGWLVTDGSWHYALGQPGDKTTDGWVGFGGRQAEHWFEFRLYRAGYLHWPTRTFQDVGGAPNYDRANLARETREATFSYGDPVVIETIANWSALWTTPGGGELYVTWSASGDGLKEEIVINQAAREWVAANAPPTTPAAETYFGFVLQVDWNDVPKVLKDGIEQNLDGDFSDDEASTIELRDAQDRLLALLPVGEVFVDNRSGEKLPLRKRFYDEAGSDFLLIGTRVDRLAALPPGDLIYDPTIDVQVGASADDGYVQGSATFRDTDSDARIGEATPSPRDAWFRFTSITVPQGASIISANASFKAWTSSNDGTGTLTNIFLEDVDDAVAPTSKANYDSKPTTTAFAAWDDFDFPDTTNFYDTPDFASAVEEVTDRLGWSSGNDLQLLIQDDGSSSNMYYQLRTYDDSASNAATLHIVYTAPPADEILLTNPTLDPISGTTVTAFSFTVDYNSTLGTPADLMKVNVSDATNGTFLNLTMTRIGSGPNATYFRIGTLPVGVYVHFFWGNASGLPDNQTAELSGPTVSALLLPELSNPGLDPASGTVDDFFNFTVNYSHPDNVPPDTVKVNVSDAWAGTYLNFTMSPLDVPADTVFVEEFWALQGSVTDFDAMQSDTDGGAFGTVGQAGDGVAITLDAANSTTSSGSATVQFNHTIGAGADRLLIVGIGVEGGSTSNDVTAVTYDGVALTQAVEHDVGPGGTRQNTEIWYMLEADLPSTGEYLISITIEAAPSDVNAGSISVVNAAQQAPEATATNDDGGAGDDAIQTPISTSTNGSWVFDVVGSGDATTFTADSGQVEAWDQTGSSSGAASSTYEASEAGDNTLGWEADAGSNRLSHVLAAFAPNGTGREALVQFNWTTLAAGEDALLEIGYNLTSADDSFGVWVWNFTASAWDLRGALSSTSPAIFAYELGTDEKSDGEARIRLNDTSFSGATNLSVGHQLVDVLNWTAGATFFQNSTLPAGDYEHFFWANDTNGEVNMTEAFEGPLVTGVTPIVAVLAAAPVLGTSARLHGNLTNLGSASSVNVSFEWGDTVDLGNQTSLQEFVVVATFQEDLTGLATATQYFFRANATGDGTNLSAILNFTTAAAVVPPNVTTGPVSPEPGRTFAVLTGTVSDFGELDVTEVNISFEWGFSPIALTFNTTPETFTSPGDFQAVLLDLEAGVTYYYRARVDWNGTIFGDVLAFTTSVPFLERPDTIAALVLSALAILLCIFALKTGQRSIGAICGVVVMLAGIVWVAILTTAIFAALIGTVILAVGLILLLTATLGRRFR